jgi:hypothetical protein
MAVELKRRSLGAVEWWPGLTPPGISGVTQYVQTAAMDFPDAGQRFNWCNCQPMVKRAAGMGEVPLFDFSFWADSLRGGGAATAIPQPASSGPFSMPFIGDTIPVSTVLLGGAALVGGYFLLSGKGKRR